MSSSPSAPPSGSIFLLSDFGNSDEFAGILRAVVVRDAPGAAVVDLTHEVPAFDVRAGALALERCVPHLGPGVVVAVVDPGVGTERRAVAVSVAEAKSPGFLVAPDNGLLTFALDALGGPTSAVALPTATTLPEQGATFDGRDLFAPAAARLWAGARLEELGSAIDPGGLLRLDRPLVKVGRGTLEAEVLWIDRFGNVQLAARPAQHREAGFGDELEVVAGDRSMAAHVARSFSVGDGLALITDSNGRLALVCQRSSAATVLGVEAGAVVVLREAR